MPATKKTFFYYVKIVAVIHLVVLLLLVFWGGLDSIFNKKKKKVILPIEFVVAVPSSSGPSDPKPIPVPKPSPKPTPKPLPVPKPKPKPKPQPQKRVKVNNERVRRNQTASKPDKLLSPEEIARRLKMGATAGTRNTAIPDEDTRGFMMIRQALYDLWQAPDKEAVGNKYAEVDVSIARDGTIIQKKLVKQSGVAVMDSSVSELLRNAIRISGLPDGFLRRHSNETITITFKVQ